MNFFSWVLFANITLDIPSVSVVGARVPKIILGHTGDIFIGEL